LKCWNALVSRETWKNKWPYWISLDPYHSILFLWEVKEMESVSDHGELCNLVNLLGGGRQIFRIQLIWLMMLYCPGFRCSRNT
jgi:hypothetical protein